MNAPPINNLDMSLSKTFALPKNMRFEFRLDMFNALNHTQFTGINSTANFASLTDKTITNLPYDASGALVRPQRLRLDQRRRTAAHPAAGDTLHVLAGLRSLRDLGRQRSLTGPSWPRQVLALSGGA